MSKPTLLSQREVTLRVADLSRAGEPMVLEVHEDRCFTDKKWLGVGNVRVHPSIDSLGDEDEWESSIMLGQYDWQPPTEDALTEELIAVTKQTLDDTHRPRVQKAVEEALQDVARRLCLTLPVFGADDVSRLPFDRPTTLVLDTSAVLQGGLAFAIRFLYPMARIKVPAVVGLEVRNMSDNYLTIRRNLGTPSTGKTAKGKRARILRDHVNSQGAERALMRLEQGSEVEVERPLEGSDPLRLIYSPDTEPDFKDLNLTRVQRSLADRLIFETAREHRRRLNAGQEVCIFTSDQGLARMALSEGILPLYFDARRTAKVLGQTLTGTRFAPFTGRLYTVPLTSLLWELATCFGACRLRIGTHELRVTAIGDALKWASYHSRDDLLWCSWALPEIIENEIPSEVPTQSVAPETVESVGTVEHPVEPFEPPETTSATTSRSAVTDALASRGEVERITAYSFSVERLLTFVVDLGNRGELDEDEALRVLGTDKPSVLNEYRKILASGSLVEYTNRSFRATENTRFLAEAIRDLNLDRMQEKLVQIPSVALFLKYAETRGDNPNWTIGVPMRKGVVTGYRSLLEVAGLGIDVPDVGFCRTSEVPEVALFAQLAQEVYDQLSTPDEPLVLTGHWLEQLSCQHGVHPIVSRSRLTEAFEANLLRRYFEGSTPDPRFSKHTLDVIENEGGMPAIRRYTLYDGTFLQSERSSVRLKVESTST